MKKLCLFGLVLAVGGCTGTETGNPNGQVELLLNARSSNLALVSLRETGGAVVVEQAWLTLDKVSLREGDNCIKPERVVETTKIGLGDHSGPDALKLSLNAPLGFYCQATADFTNGPGSRPLGAPEEVLNHSIVIVGRLADGTKLKIASNFEAQIRLDASAQPIEIGADDAAILMEFDIATWLNGIDLATAEKDPIEGIVLSDTKNTAHLARFEGNVAPGVELFRDVARNGQVDPEDTKTAGGSL
ncbi:MAG: hypothetical protein SFV15_00890 [Polyangiaceae bacterium]|nr:hypothetical protein [Polyangiaceae bacterium]